MADELNPNPQLDPEQTDPQATQQAGEGAAAVVGEGPEAAQQGQPVSGGSAQPIDDPLPGPPPGGQAGRQQVAAGRRLPVEHLPRTKYAGPLPEHERVIELGEAHATGTGDRFVQRARRLQGHRHRLDRTGESCGIGTRTRTTGARSGSTSRRDGSCRSPRWAR